MLISDQNKIGHPVYNWLTEVPQTVFIFWVTFHNSKGGLLPAYKRLIRVHEQGISWLLVEASLPKIIIYYDYCLSINFSNVLKIALSFFTAA